METQLEKELSVGTIITDGEYVLGCLPYGRMDAKGNYDLPKGHWEENEEIIDTAIRECQEETGYIISVPDAYSITVRPRVVSASHSALAAVLTLVLG